MSTKVTRKRVGSLASELTLRMFNAITNRTPETEKAAPLEVIALGGGLRRCARRAKSKVEIWVFIP